MFVVINVRIDESKDASTRNSLHEPLGPRSIVLSVLLGSHPPHMPVSRILEFTSLFDLADGAVRTALSRMVAAGELVNDDGIYRLAGRLVERQAQQDAGRRRVNTDWDRTWWTVTALSERRTMAERRAFRTWAVGARLGELRPEVWLRPANVDIAADLPEVLEVLVTRGRITSGDALELVGRLWDLDALRDRSTRHQRALDATAVRLEDPDDHSLADAFTALAAAQQFLRVEPQLPAEVMPHATGDDLRVRYDEVVDVFQTRLARFFTERNGSRVSTTAP